MIEGMRKEKKCGVCLGSRRKKRHQWRQNKQLAKHEIISKNFKGTMDTVDRCYRDIKATSDLNRTTRFGWDKNQTAEREEWLGVKKTEILSMDTFSIYY